MNECKRISIDLAKNVFQICLFDANNKVIKNKKVRRAKLLHEMRQLPPTAIVAMEGCSSAHHWARQFRGLGFSHIILVPAQHVKPFVGVQKNDANGTMPMMPERSVKQLFGRTYILCRLKH